VSLGRVVSPKRANLGRNRDRTLPKMMSGVSGGHLGEGCVIRAARLGGGIPEHHAPRWTLGWTLGRIHPTLPPREVRQ
jgi:hypothetical protein